MTTIINEQLFEKVTRRAQNSPRLRMNYNFHQSIEEKRHRMLNAVEPGTVMPIHRHLASSETVALLRGKIHWYFYDDNGKVDEEVVLDANGDLRCINVEKGRWHSLECLESGSVLLESKDGAYQPLTQDELLEMTQK